MVQLSFDIEKTFRLGIATLILSALSAGFVILICLYQFSEVESIGRDKKEVVCSPCPCVIPFGLKGETISLPLPNVQSEFVLCFAPSKPQGKEGRDTFFLRLKKGGEVRKISLPERVDFRYEKGLRFAGQKGPFWVSFSKKGEGSVLASAFVANSLGEEKEVGSFLLKPEESPIRLGTEFAEGSPFRVLSEGRCIGQDLFLKKYGAKDSSLRVEFTMPGNHEIISLYPNDFLVWKEERWRLSSSPELEEGPIVQMVSFDERSALFQGWIGEEYVRLVLPYAPQVPFKTKAEDFLSAVRIRSEKQISCMLDRQCFVLRVGDAVLKTENRWKILRRKEEKDAYMEGKLTGELFVFDRIESKAQKVVCGSLFNQIRSQLIPIESVVHTQNGEGALLDKRKHR